MSFFSNIVNFFKGAKAKVSAFFAAVLGEKAAKELGDATVEALKSALGLIVKEVVASVKDLGMGSAEARAEAFKRIVELAQQQGLLYSTSLINLLIELAVQQLKGNVVSLEK